VTAAEQRFKLTHYPVFYEPSHDVTYRAPGPWRPSCEAELCFCIKRNCVRT
jgi:hypothetical protein